MSYAIIRRVNAVRQRLDDRPPPASLIYAVLYRWSVGRNTASIAKGVRVPEHEVYRIIAADQDCRRFAAVTAEKLAAATA